MNKQRSKILIASVIGALASFLPFCTVNGGIITNRNYAEVTMTGFDSIAVTTFVIFLITIVMCLFGKRNQSFSIGGRIFLILLALINIYIIIVFLLGDAYAEELSNYVSDQTFSLANLNVNLGIGFWIMFFATFAIIIFSFAKKNGKAALAAKIKVDSTKVIRE